MPETIYITYNFQMKQENIDFLEANKPHLINAQNEFFKNLDGNTRLRFQNIIAEEFRPGYTADLWCDKCALEMIKILATHYQQWQDAQPKEKFVPTGEEPITVPANFPKHEEEREQMKIPTADNSHIVPTNKNHRRR